MMSSKLHPKAHPHRWLRTLALLCGTLWGFGACAQSLSSVTVQASADLAAGIGAQMELHINGTLIGSVEVRASAYQPYTFNAPAPLRSGDRIDVVFVNDESVNGEDRNLFVESVTAAGKTVLSDAPGVTLDVGLGIDAFDGIDVIPGQSVIPWAAALRFPPLVLPSSVIVNAKADLAGGIGALIELHLNGTLISTTEVRSTSYQPYAIATPGPVGAGDRIDVVFINDDLINGEDRNLYVQSVRVNGATLLPTDPGVTLDQGYGPEAFDGLDVIPGQTDIPWTAALRFPGLSGTAALPPPVSSALPVAHYEYDAQGNPTRTVQAPGVSGLNFSTVSTYDALNRQKDTTDARNGKTQFAYDGLDRTTQVTDPRNLVTQMPRNGLGDVTQLVSPDTGTATHTYDAAGNLKTRTDSRGVLATYSYDALSRLTSVVYSQSGQPSLTYAWAYDQSGTGFANGIGRLTSTTHPGGSTQYAYDPQGRLVSDTQRVNAATGANSAQISTTVTYGYDAGGHITSIVYPSGRVLSVTYVGGQPSALSLASDATSTASPLISQITWQPFGAPTGWLWQMGTATQAYDRVFDTAGRLVRYPLGGFVRDLAYDAADRITAYTHLSASTGTATAAATALNQTFGYDELSRLTSITTSTASWSIGYDANGNRTGLTLNGTPSTYTTQATSNRLSSTSNPARSFGYDNTGNTTSDTGAAFTASYNLAGRMASLTKAAVTTSYSVDGLGRRVRKFSSSGAASTVIFVYDQVGQLLGEYSSSGAVIREYVWLGSTPVAIVMPDAANAANPPRVFYVQTDHLDTPRAVIDTAGQLRWRWLAEPFGNSAPETNPLNLGAFTQNLRFPGQYADAESGLFYNYFRDYDASLGRYAQSDPIGLNGGINTYAYVGGNPLLSIDSEGLASASLPTAGGPAGGWLTSPTGQMRLYDLNGKAACDIDFHKDHGAGTPHAHNWENGSRGPGVPMTVLRP